MALDAGLRDVLQSLESDISITIQLPCLLPFLRRKRLVTQSELQQLSSDGKESDLEKNRKLIRIITGKGENAYDLFIEALQEEGEHLGHASLVKKLMNEKKKIKSAVCPPEPPTTPTPTFPPKSNALQEQVSLLIAVLMADSAIIILIACMSYFFPTFSRIQVQ